MSSHNDEMSRDDARLNENQQAVKPARRWPTIAALVLVAVLLLAGVLLPSWRAHWQWRRAEAYRAAFAKSTRLISIRTASVLAFLAVADYSY